jgi:hypothetical protein
MIQLNVCTHFPLSPPYQHPHQLTRNPPYPTVLIGFWSTSTDSQILASGNIPAHLIFVALIFHLFLYHIPVSPFGWIPPIFTGLLYCLVTGIYTLGNNGEGPYEPESTVMNWQNGLTAAAIFIALAVIILSFWALFAITAARDLRWPPPLLPGDQGIGGTAEGIVVEEPMPLPVTPLTPRPVLVPI